VKNFVRRQIWRISIEKIIFFLILGAGCFYGANGLFLISEFRQTGTVRIDSSNSTGLIIWGVLILAFIILILMSFISLINYRLCRAYKVLSKLGPGSREVSETISKEMADGPIVRHRNLVVLKTYVIYRILGSFVVYKKDDLVWAYSMTLTKTANGITRSKSYVLWLWFANGRSIRQPIKSAAVCAHSLDRLEDDYPYAFYGFSDELNRLFRKNRREFVKMVAEHRMAVRV